MEKRSAIWTMPLDAFRTIVAESNSIADVVRKFDFAVTGKAHKAVKDRIKAEGIDAQHIPLGLASNKGRKFKTTSAFPLEDVLVDNSTYDRKNLKKRLLGGGLLKNECKICGQPPIWNGLPLVLVLDHENGKRDDNRLENLRLLCSHCNSQQKTFAGRNKHKSVL
jgi:hypothetical protein